MIPKDVVEEPEPPKKKRRRKFRTADPEPDKLVRPQARPLSAPSRTRCRTRSPAEPDKWVDQLVEYPVMQPPRDTHLPEEQQNQKSEDAKVKDFQRFTPFAKIEPEGHQAWKFSFPASTVNPEGASYRVVRLRVDRNSSFSSLDLDVPYKIPDNLLFEKELVRDFAGQVIKGFSDLKIPATVAEYQKLPFMARWAICSDFERTEWYCIHEKTLFIESQVEMRFFQEGAYHAAVHQALTDGQRRALLDEYRQEGEDDTLAEASAYGARRELTDDMTGERHPNGKLSPQGINRYIATGQIWTQTEEDINGGSRCLKLRI